MPFAYPEEVRRSAVALYRDLGSCREVAERLDGPTARTVHRWVVEEGVETGGPGGAYRRKTERAKRWAKRYEDGESGAEIARDAGVHPSLVYRTLEREGVERRPPGRDFTYSLTIREAARALAPYMSVRGLSRQLAGNPSPTAILNWLEGDDG